MKPRRFRSILLCCAFILIGCALPALQCAELWQNRTAKAAHEKRLKTSETLAFDISQLLASVVKSRPTFEEARGILASRGILAERPSLSWTSPRGERIDRWTFFGKVDEATVTLEFLEGLWTDVSIPVAELRRPPLQREWATRLAINLRQLAIIGWIGCSVFVLRRPINWSRRRSYWPLTALMLISVFATFPSWHFSYWRWIVFDDPGWRLLILILTIAIWWRAWPRVNRENLRVCHKCGYDLFGNTTGVCPECGRAMEASQRAYVTGCTT